jgi:N-acetylmuramoyl-L-alanine amidase
MARETQARASEASLPVLRSVIAQYEALVARYPRSGYSDNALWQAAGIALFAFEQHGQEADRGTATRLLRQLRKSYPSGSLARQVPARLSQISAAVRRTPAAPERAVATSAAAPPVTGAAAVTPGALTPDPTPPIRLTAITRSALPTGERLTIALDSEPQYREERLSDPERLFFDFRNTAAADTARPGLQRLTGGVVRDVRLGVHPARITRLVLELEPNTRHSVFALYNPYRLVVDLERASVGPIAPAGDMSAPVASVPLAKPQPPPITTAVPRASDPARDAGPPVVPSANANGSFSLARQLGLGVARIVIDPGHGGHDPGAIANRAREAELVLDIALRLEKLLLKQQGIDVVLTRRTDVFVPLEERTAIANREDADLFLSIHANVGRNSAASGIETYFLNFATNPEAEAVAARENAGAGMAMHTLPDIVRKIALNNKLDESRDLANAVQTSLYRGIRQQNAQARNRGVKQAPFVVLIGAQMPSVLAEVSFVTNKKEAGLLKTPAFRQRIAQALFDAVVKYRQSLKKVGTVASGAETR